MIAGHSLQEVVDAGYAPSVRWLATGIKEGRIPGRMIGRYWRTWRMTEDDLARFLDATQPAAASPPDAAAADPAAPGDSIIDGLTARAARRLRSAS
ncbi:hypothetical protein [Mycolicibacterium elephantis]|uniref:hypothetical protein n=1 Tax=Mycolicibacterium elephantis TaxID=81858 RepID=UPI0007EA63CC|nr:hypothetical protein [Mycolicibacterium elephantis]OBB20597.1 hypothetical protein A5762_15155 [Mycolicibacterium elephantis]